MPSTSSSKSVPQTAPVTYANEEAGIECSPGACAKACGGCLMFLISLAAISALGVIAGGSFWTAQSMFKLTDGISFAKVNLCTTEATGTHLQGNLTAGSAHGIPSC